MNSIKLRRYVVKFSGLMLLKSIIPVTEQLYIRNKTSGPEHVPCLQVLLYYMYLPCTGVLAVTVVVSLLIYMYKEGKSARPCFKTL